tara:strand:+ start:594 stop:887 length:294 start_codon:yes stop_codon:yes gene_type:complete
MKIITEIPGTYKAQGGCHNCKHVFMKYDYDEGPCYYCHLDGTERPLCMSVAMDGESVEDNTVEGEVFHEAFQKWHKWADARGVAAWGICDSYEEGAE